MGNHPTTSLLTSEFSAEKVAGFARLFCDSNARHVQPIIELILKIPEQDDDAGHVEEAEVVVDQVLVAH